MALFSSIWDDIRHVFRIGNMVTRLTLLNFVVFVLVSLGYVGMFVAYQGEGHIDAFWKILDYFCMPADWRELLWHPWTPLTHMFLHQGFWHILSNLIWLSIFGTIVGDLIGDRRILPIYLLGGLAGGLAFFASASVLPYVGDHALGASAAVMALAGAALILAPDYRVMLFLLGEVKLKYIVLVMVLLDLVGFANQANTGGHAAHLGGLLMGILFVYRLRDGHDLAEPVNRLLDTIGGWFGGKRRRPATVKRKPQMAFKGGAPPGGHATDSNDLSYQEKLDAILDKIKAQGYENLSPEEKEFLYNASKK